MIDQRWAEVREIVEKRLHDLPRRDRRHALRILRWAPIRLLGNCLVCEAPTGWQRVGIYVPRRESPVQQVVVYVLCPEHEAAGDRLVADVGELELRIEAASSSRPHVPLGAIVRR